MTPARLQLHDKYADVCFELVLELRGFYVKIAQVGSTRTDVMPKQFLDKFVTLQDKVCAL